MKNASVGQFEWDFFPNKTHDVPQSYQMGLDELEHAHHWEFGREREIWQERTKQFRQEFKKKQRTLYSTYKEFSRIVNVIPPGDGFDSYFYSFEDNDGGIPSIWLADELRERIKLPDATFLYSPEWPDAPYFTIKKSESLRRISLFNVRLLPARGTL